MVLVETMRQEINREGREEGKKRVMGESFERL